MALIAQGLTVPQAMHIAHKTMLSDASKYDAVASLIGARQITKISLRANQPEKSGYGGIDGARKMLNDMIFESMTKYDAEISKCTDFYAKQCALMEIARGQIAAANYVAANSRALILDAQGNINRCEAAIPAAKMELKNHNQLCKDELRKLNMRLKTVMGDIAVMTMILKMTDCDSKKLVQMERLVMLRCLNGCTKKYHVLFNQKDLQRELTKLQSPVSADLLTASFGDMFDANTPLRPVEFAQMDSFGYQEPMVNKTKFVNPPIPRTPVPGDPCQDPNKGAPSAADKRAAKCSLGKSPQCYKLQSRFLAIQGGIADERDSILDEIASLDAACQEQAQTIGTAIENDQSLLDSSQTKLAMATEKEATAGEQARQTAKENEQYNNDLIKQMKTCTANYINFETEQCALKKIRGELYKLKGGGHSAFFQDCEVSRWTPEECTKVCGTGEQKLTRNILTPRKGGTKCLPLEAVKSCNNQPCPVNCKLGQWGGWSKCSAKCAGGVTQRVRDVKQASRYGGTKCSATSDARVCNGAACEKDCELGPWTRWTSCTKDCGGGTRKKQRLIKHNAEGAGKCASAWDPARLEYKKCNMKRCKLANNTLTLTCNSTMDVTLLIDACPKSGGESFKAQILTATTFVDAFTGDAKFAVIKYCGPRTWSGVSQCGGKSSKSVNVEKVCHVKVVQHYTRTKAKAITVLQGLVFAKGTKLTALALLAAKSELQLGRKDARSVVVAFQDGQPLSFRQTQIAARSLRKSARLIWVVVTKFAPLKSIKLWATRRWQENIVQVNSAQQLAKPATVTEVIADICPSETPKLEMRRKK